MPYSDMTVEEMILHAVGFVGRGLKIPDGIKAELSQDLIWEIENPETTIHGYQEPERPRHW